MKVVSSYGVEIKKQNIPIRHTLYTVSYTHLDVYKRQGIHTAPQVVWTIIGGTAMMITAIVGYKGIKALSNVAVPLLFVLAMAALGITLARVPFASITSKGPVGVAIPLTVGIASVVGNTAVSVVIVSDSVSYPHLLVVSPVQIYLDCMQLKGRGEEMAEAVLMKEIIK